MKIMRAVSLVRILGMFSAMSLNLSFHSSLSLTFRFSAMKNSPEESSSYPI
jgi:hypothetical protein